MEHLIRVLMVGDAPDDAELIVSELRQGGFDVQGQRVNCARAMTDALEQSPWDVIVADYAIPGFGGLQALKLVKELELDKPFIIISGMVGEEAAVEAMRAGAHDFLLKRNLTRLVPAIRRELAEAAMRQDHRRAEKELREQLEFVQVLIDTLPTPIFYNDPNGLNLGCNKAFEEQLGMKKGEILNKSIFTILPADVAAALCSKGQEAFNGRSRPATFEGTISCADGENREVIFYSAAFATRDSGRGGVVGAVLDISERKRNEMKLRYLSSHDMLTGIYNRAYFDEELDRLKKGRKFPVSIVMADVDRLKEVNDQLGHAAGDELLKHAAAVFKGAFRHEDVAARVGGDEFAALLPGINESALGEALERLQQHLAQSTKDNGWSSFGLSIGGATAYSGEELMAAWRKADERMYEEKKRRSACELPCPPRDPALWTLGRPVPIT